MKYLITMKTLLIIALLLLNLRCFSQELEDVVICNNVIIYQIKSGKYLTSCSCSEKNILETFGVPDSIKVTEILTLKKYKTLYYGPDSFTPTNRDIQRYISFKSDQFKLIVNDSVQIRVNNSIEKVLKCFPYAASHIQHSEKGVSDLTIYHAYNKAQAIDKSKLFYTSVLIIQYSTLSKNIVNILFIDRD
jgi:hypothetical protein